MSFEKQLAAALEKFPSASAAEIVSTCCAAGQAERERAQEHIISAELAASAQALQEFDQRNARAAPAATQRRTFQVSCPTNAHAQALLAAAAAMKQAGGPDVDTPARAEFDRLLNFPGVTVLP